MSSDLRLRVGNITAQISLNGANGQITDAQVATALTRFADSLGIPINGTATENLTAILLHEKDHIRRVSRLAQVTAGLNAARVDIEAAADGDNDL